ncbi:uncharacterized protein LOC129574366 [Sitodiplosis mosellana]|uniref:uncharacterized protein LOC129574366 n=1 Tax=Sitodiplosis mosellana TaxID=263140 RepID=UPI002444BE97|nr:uncharacterized protein LOC129574366 [Sitodiplosis mosellana]XP_055312266.1 uncharacterized protein LOC129574366 [Sitodiplosis mosellana]XP_055312268.1 uncharacterized protein LOC129574366 [Sitodiplosis mosellana]XP_055312269.1 uncharacterized protein LOC129574366 [Sitodiplosis mosellana]XP_055312270.1 uncharacterized protein LOC129574366 [Sitodiplosis mosellana]XP_055312271.1 uncharacterized protein LOC129574366 [Sitodiplosis mosellana]XP_055312272.1 uncharacterized protein LOC129574366 [
MSYTTAETGRVKSIKSKFENLNSLESLDISATVPHKYRKPSPSFLFKRSSTSIDLPIHRQIAVINSNKLKISPPKQPPPPRPPSSSIIETNHKSPSIINTNKKIGYLRRHNNLDRTVSADAFVVKKRNLAANDEDTLKPLKEIKENVEVRLTRHTNDPVKRSSIKRSPAFRVGDKSNCSNSNSTKNGSNSNVSKDNGTKCAIKSNRTTASTTPTPTTTTTITTTNNGVPVISPEFAEKFENLLKRCDIETRQQLDEPGLTDTLKAVLRQPLPSGPPPKKPPRTFIDSPKQTTTTVQTPDTPTHSSDDEKSSTKGRSHVPATVTVATAPTNKMRQKIDLLENQLVLKTNNKAKGTTRNATKHPFSSSLLNCIPCSSASIYDTMIIGPNQFGKVITSKEPPSPEKIQAATTTTTTTTTTIGKINRNVIRSPNSEPIYMEPFAHLKHAAKTGNGTTTSSPPHKCNSFGVIVSPTPSHLSNEPKLLSSSLSNTSFDGPESLGSSLTSCTSCTADDHSINDLHDIHYMCTSIENKIKSSDSDSNSNEANDQPLPNTYDEINILVNAAFEQHKANDGMGNAIDSMQVSPSISHSSSPTNNETVNQERTNTKLSRRLTEKRKEYVKKVSVQRIQPDSLLSNDSMHQTFKSTVFRTFSIDNTDNDSINSNGSSGNKHVSPKNVVGSVGSDDRNDNITDGRKSDNDNEVDDLDGGNESIPYDDGGDTTPKLFQVCLLIGFNNSTRQAYIKSKFPADEEIPLNIEQLVFPSRNLINQTRKNQDYSIILTDGNGYHVYGYCRRILPESCEICLPLAYCIISEVKAPGFYFKILREIETRHGQAEFQTNFLLQSLQTRSIPAAGKFLHLKLPLSPRPKTISTQHHKVMPKRLSLEVNPRWLTESAAQAAFSNCETDSMVATTKKERSNQAKSLVQEFEEKKQNGAPFDLSLINRSLFNGKSKCDEIFIRRPNDLRLESTELSDLYQALGSDLLIVVFSTLLLERKVILCTENISILSSCVLGLQTLLYPFQWQHTIITILPESLVDICEAPIPVLAGLLKPIDFKIEDAIVIDLNTKTLLQKCGDETTILPTSLSHSLKVSLEMVDLLDQGKMLSSVLIAEAFLRCFVELFVGYKHKTFNKVEFIASHSSQSYRLFLEWFVETAMFRHFVQQKFSEPDPINGPNTASWMAQSNFYDLFDSRILKNENESSSTQQNMEIIMKNCKVINKTKTKTFKDRFKDFISSSSNNN